jgi:hypothetical protein
LEHLADCGDDFICSDHSGEDIDGGDPDLIEGVEHAL